MGTWTKKSATLITLGCPKNTVISDKIKKRLINCGYLINDDPRKSELILINTCGFIEPAKEESIETILEIAARKNGKGNKLIAFGCLVERYKEELSKSIPEVDIFLDFGDLENLESTLNLKRNNIAEPVIGKINSWSYLQIAEGCDRKCSFCAIPLIKGPYISRTKKAIIEEAKGLTAGGAKELTLIAQDTSSFGKDLAEEIDLEDLIVRLADIDSVNWLRLMYLQPDIVDEWLVRILKNNNKLCKYIDIPFQHADKKILRSMKRNGSGTDYLRLVEKIRESIPEIVIRTAVMVGYPGETEKEFSELKGFLIDLKPDYLGVFEFSPEEGTSAAGLADQVSPAVKRERLNEIRLLGDELAIANRRNRLGQVTTALIEKVSDRSATGRLEWQAPEIDGEVIIKNDGSLAIGDMIRVRITEYCGYDLVAEWEK